MANRIITASVCGEYIGLSSKVAGAAGSYAAVSLELSFDSAWDGTTKKLYFIDSLGTTGVYVILTTEMLKAGTTDVYVVPIPAEPLAYEGEMILTIRGVEVDGETTERVIMATSARMTVTEAVMPAGDVAPTEPTPTQTELLQSEIDAILADIVLAAAAADSADEAAASAADALTAKTAAEAAQAAAESARAAAVTAQGLAVAAKAAAETAEGNAGTSEANALIYKLAAEAAQAAAETAQGLAEAAQAAAETARAAAESAETGSETAKAAAEAAQAAAVTAKTAAQAAQTAAETAEANALIYKTAAETAKTAAETARTDAQTALTAALAAKAAAEAAQTAAVTAKTAAETAETNAETAETNAVTAKTAAETAQGFAEAANTAAQGAKTAAQSAQTAAETAKTAAETAEANAEGSAEDAEAWAVGTRGGVPVGAEDPAYHNNSLYYKEIAEEIVGGNFLTTSGDGSNTTVTFAEAESYAAPVSGETQATLWGKVKKLFSSLGTAAFTASTAYDAAGTASSAVSTHNGASGAHQNLLIAYEVAATRANIYTGLSIANILGRIQKWFTDLGTAAFEAATSFAAAIHSHTVSDVTDFPTLADVATTGAYSDLTGTPTIPDQLSDLSEDATHRTVTDAEKGTWSGKQSATNTLTEEAALADADTIPFYDATATAHRKTTWANIVSKIRTALFDSTSGILKANGSGTVSAATANTDYVAPSAAGAYALISALPEVTIADADRIPFLDASGSTAGYVQKSNLAPTLLYEKISDIADTSGTGSVSIDISSINWDTWRSIRLICEVKDSRTDEHIYVRINNLSSGYGYAYLSPGGSGLSVNGSAATLGQLMTNVSAFQLLDFELQRSPISNVPHFIMHTAQHETQAKCCFGRAYYAFELTTWSSLNLTSEAGNGTIYLQNASLWGVKR